MNNSTKKVLKLIGIVYLFGPLIILIIIGTRIAFEEPVPLKDTGIQGLTKTFSSCPDYLRYGYLCRYEAKARFKKKLIWPLYNTEKYKNLCISVIHCISRKKDCDSIKILKQHCPATLKQLKKEHKKNVKKFNKYFNIKE